MAARPWPVFSVPSWRMVKQEPLERRVLRAPCGRLARTCASPTMRRRSAPTIGLRECWLLADIVREIFRAGGGDSGKLSVAAIAEVLAGVDKAKLIAERIAGLLGFGAGDPG